MFFLREQNKSFPQKIFILICLCGTVFLVLFNNRYPLDLRPIVIIVCVTIYLIRLIIMFFIFLKRKILWSEAFEIAFLMSIVLFVITYTGKINLTSLTAIDIIGVFIYILGSFINTYSECLRYKWKKNPKNKGHIYKYGLFKYSMHINYFGDVLLFTGLSILTGTFWTLIIPIGMLLNFIAFTIPSLDSYLSQKYGDKFTEYSKNTKKIIPYIY
jgi:steroid 5-alpha reductase family enzyme